jgi:hypothetical protein
MIFKEQNKTKQNKTNRLSQTSTIAASANGGKTQAELRWMYRAPRKDPTAVVQAKLTKTFWFLLVQIQPPDRLKLITF